MLILIGSRNRNDIFQVEKCLKNPNNVYNFPDTQSLLKNDKGHYGNRQLTTAEERFLVEIHPNQPNGPFPRDSNGRSFSNFYHKKTLQSGLVTERSWLYYSSILNQCYCLPCWLFSESKDSLATGFNGWIHLHQTLSRHESKNEHNLSCSIFDQWRKIKRSKNQKILNLKKQSEKKNHFGEKFSFV